VALRWTLEALGLPREAGGGFVTGATVANFTTLAAARHRVLARQGRTGLADLVERTCRHAARLAEGLAAAGHRVLNEYQDGFYAQMTRNASTSGRTNGDFSSRARQMNESSISLPASGTSMASPFASASSTMKAGRRETPTPARTSRRIVDS
jgi:glutamate/tyrosine decarboxylase-like PLP-dependent enzyme